MTFKCAYQFVLLEMSPKVLIHVPYGGKISREKTFATFATFAVMWLFAKVFSALILHSVGIYYSTNRDKFDLIPISLLIQVFQELNLKAYDLNVDNLDVHAVSLSYTRVSYCCFQTPLKSLSLRRGLGMRL